MTEFDKKDEKVVLEPPKRADSPELDKLGVDLSRLAAGTRLLIETEKAVYDAEVYDGAAIKLHAPADAEFSKPFLVQVRGSLYDKGAIKNGWIGRGCRLELRGVTNTYFVGPVWSILIILPSGTEVDPWD